MSRRAVGGSSHGGAAASFMGERIGAPMAFALGVGALGVEPSLTEGVPVARAA